MRLRHAVAPLVGFSQSPPTRREAIVHVHTTD